ncbi:MAG: imidazole glycerol phosphate synthase subunit HisH [Bdellovibrionales bacterium]
MIVIVDSGVANLASVMAALERLQAEAMISADPATIREAGHVILPGVGSAQAAMAKLRERKLVDTLRGLTQPVLGICLGMQMLFDQSEEGAEEGGYTPCLGLIKGTVKRMQAAKDSPIPHMGWNQLAPYGPASPLLEGIPKESYVYFVHSYAAPLGDATRATCEYAANAFTAIASERNFHGCQFHPERSGAIGSRILQNFLKI